MNENDNPSRTRGTSTVAAPAATRASRDLAGRSAGVRAGARQGRRASGRLRRVPPRASRRLAVVSLGRHHIVAISWGCGCCPRPWPPSSQSHTPTLYGHAFRRVSRGVAVSPSPDAGPSIHCAHMHASPSSSWRMDANTTHLSHSQPLLLYKYCTVLLLVHTAQRVGPQHVMGNGVESGSSRASHDQSKRDEKRSRQMGHSYASSYYVLLYCMIMHGLGLGVQPVINES